MKIKVRSFFLSIALVLLVPAGVFAQTSSSAVPAVQNTISTQKDLTKTSNLKTRADREIDRRTTSLNAVIVKMNGNKKLTADQKSSLVSQIQTEITNLAALKTKIDADSDPQMLKTDVQSVISAYRVYALFIPQIHLLTAANVLSDASDAFSSVSAQLQTRIGQAQLSGKDVTSLLTLLSDMQAKIADAKTQAQNVISNVLPLTPAGYPGNKVTLQSARDMLKTGRSDLQIARQDAKAILQGLRGLQSSSASGSLPPPATTSAGSLH